jgi:hypothetical protein
MGALFRSQGMTNPTPRIRMLDGFNEGWIEFENGEASSRKGEVAIPEWECRESSACVAR